MALVIERNYVEMFLRLLQLKNLKGEVKEASNNPQALLVEAIHSAGYSGALAHSLMAQESTIGRLDSSALEQFVAVSLICNLYTFYFMILTL